MPLVMEKEKLAYYPMHKCANSSVKQMLYQIETGTPFTTAESAPKTSVHVHFGKTTTPFRPMKHEKADGLFKFAVVRDPVSRFVSGYKWLVFSKGVYARKATAAWLAERGLTTQPTLAVFMKNLATYLEARQIARTHLAPLSHFLGPDSAYYDAVYNMKDLPVLAADLSQRCGCEVTSVKANTTKALGVTVRPTAAQTKKIKDIYESDYEVYGAFL